MIRKIGEGRREVLGTRVGVMEILGRVVRGDLAENVAFE